MSPEQFQQILSTAEQLLGEIEWCDFWGLPEERQAGVREEFAELLKQESFIPLAKKLLHATFDNLREQIASMSGHQEPDLIAAGLAQSALKAAAVVAWPDMPELLQVPIRTKFTRWEDPQAQAPQGVQVPSRAGQQQIHAAFDADAEKGAPQ